MIYFTADWHLFHTNIIKYCNRPFRDAKEMNKTIMTNYRKFVKEEDEVWFLGDLTMMGSNAFEQLQSMVMSLPGHKHLVLGNHDRMRPGQYIDMGFSSVHTSYKMSLLIEGELKELYLAHDPALAQIPDTLWVCGHIHNHWKTFKIKKLNIKLFNCGVDVNKFCPVPLECVLKKLGN